MATDLSRRQIDFLRSLSLGDIVITSDHIGALRYLGGLDRSSDSHNDVSELWAGIELAEPTGTMNGSLPVTDPINGQTTQIPYFSTEKGDKYGIFVPALCIHKTVSSWNLLKKITSLLDKYKIMESNLSKLKHKITTYQAQITVYKEQLLSFTTMQAQLNKQQQSSYVTNNNNKRGGRSNRSNRNNSENDGVVNYHPSGGRDGRDSRDGDRDESDGKESQTRPDPQSARSHPQEEQMRQKRHKRSQSSLVSIQLTPIVTNNLKSGKNSKPNNPNDSVNHNNNDIRARGSSTNTPSLHTPSPMNIVQTVSNSSMPTPNTTSSKHMHAHTNSNANNLLNYSPHTYASPQHTQHTQHPHYPSHSQPQASMPGDTHSHPPGSMPSDANASGRGQRSQRSQQYSKTPRGVQSVRTSMQLQSQIVPLSISPALDQDVDTPERMELSPSPSQRHRSQTHSHSHAHAHGQTGRRTTYHEESTRRGRRIARAFTHYGTNAHYAQNGTYAYTSPSGRVNKLIRKGKSRPVTAKTAQEFAGHATGNRTHNRDDVNYGGNRHNSEFYDDGGYSSQNDTNSKHSYHIRKSIYHRASHVHAMRMEAARIEAQRNKPDHRNDRDLREVREMKEASENRDNRDNINNSSNNGNNANNSNDAETEESPELAQLRRIRSEPKPKPPNNSSYGPHEQSAPTAPTQDEFYYTQHGQHGRNPHNAHNSQSGGFHSQPRPTTASAADIAAPAMRPTLVPIALHSQSLDSHSHLPREHMYPYYVPHPHGGYIAYDANGTPVTSESAGVASAQRVPPLYFYPSYPAFGPHAQHPHRPQHGQHPQPPHNSQTGLERDVASKRIHPGPSGAPAASPAAPTSDGGEAISAYSVYKHNSGYGGYSTHGGYPSGPYHRTTQSTAATIDMNSPFHRPHSPFYYFPAYVGLTDMAEGAGGGGRHAMPSGAAGPIGSSANGANPQPRPRPPQLEDLSQLEQMQESLQAMDSIPMPMPLPIAISQTPLAEPQNGRDSSINNMNNLVKTQNTAINDDDSKLVELDGLDAISNTRGSKDVPRKRVSNINIDPGNMESNVIENASVSSMDHSVLSGHGNGVATNDKVKNGRMEAMQTNSTAPEAKDSEASNNGSNPKIQAMHKMAASVVRPWSRPATTARMQMIAQIPSRCKMFEV